MSCNSGERGLSLIEVLVASALLVTVLAVFGSLYAVVKRSTNVSQAMGAGTDQVAVALSTLDAQIRSSYWTALGTTNCRTSAGVIMACTVVKVLTTYQATPNNPRCWVWAITPLPGIAGHPDVDPHNRYGRLQSGSYAPGSGPPVQWQIEADSLDWTLSSLDLTAEKSVLDPTTGLIVPGRFAGVAATISIAQDDVRRVTTAFSVVGRNPLIAQQPAIASLTCPRT